MYVSFYCYQVIYNCLIVNTIILLCKTRTPPPLVKCCTLLLHRPLNTSRPTAPAPGSSCLHIIQYTIHNTQYTIHNTQYTLNIKYFTKHNKQNSQELSLHITDWVSLLNWILQMEDKTGLTYSLGSLLSWELCLGLHLGNN